jgi:subtilase family protein
MKIRTTTTRSHTALLAVALLSTGLGLATAGDFPIDLYPQYSQFSKTPGIQKIEYRLLCLANQATKDNKSLSDLLLENSQDTPTDEFGSPLFEIVSSSVTPQLRQLLNARGVRIVHESRLKEKDPNLNAFLTISQVSASVLEEIAVVDEVSFVRTASGFKNFAVKETLDVGSVDGKAAESLKADILRNQYDVDGTGINVGILSDSFTSQWAEPNQQTDDYTASGRGGEYIFDFSGLDGLEGTFIVQTVLDNKVTIEWESLDQNVILYQSEIEYPIEETNCRNRNPLSGLIDKQTVTSIELDGFPASSCSEGGDGYALFAFKVGISDPGDPTHRGRFKVSVPGETLPTFSLRTNCSDLASELFCDVGEEILGASGLWSQANGNLPDFVTVIEDYPATGYGDVSNEGTAMGELIYDIAPGAKMGFHTAWQGQANFAEGIYRLSNYIYDPDQIPFFADIIVDDILYYREPMYQEGIISNAISSVVRGRTDLLDDYKVTYFSAAGNSANNSFKLQYEDVQSGDERPTFPPEGGDLMKWPHGNGYLPITLDPGGYFFAVIQWNQPFSSTSWLSTGAQIDFNAFVTQTPNADGIEGSVRYADNYPGSMTYSINPQGNSDRNYATGDPYEQVSFFNTSDERQTVYLAIDHFHGAKDYIPQIADVPVELRIVFVNLTSDVTIEGIEYRDSTTGGPTIYGHAASPDVIAVGAANYYGVREPSSFGPTEEIDPETFTSAGGSLENLFDVYGKVKRMPAYKPDLTSVDGNSTSFFGVGDFDLDGHLNFFGTSAAAPNAAAVAALLLQMNHSLSPQQVRTALVETTDDVKGEFSLPGRDNTTGFGVINARKAGDFVRDQYGLQPGNPSSSSEHIFNFVGSSQEGWVPEGTNSDPWVTIDPEQPQGPPYTNPNFGVSQDGVTMSAPDTNTLGWWKSPNMTASPFVVPGTISLNANPGSDSIFRAKYTVTSDGATTADVPTLRLRTSREEFDRSEVYVIVQNGNEAGFLPIAPRNYITYFNLSPTSAFFHHYIDLLGFNGTPGTKFTINLVDVEALIGGTSVLSNQNQEALLLFSGGSGNTYGWTLEQGASDTFGRISGQATANGLEIGGARDLDELACFGFWQSDESNPILTLEQNAFYRAKFLVSTNTPVDQKAKVPTLRLRLNTANFEWANYIEINGISEGSEFPVAGEDVAYYMYFETPDELIGQPINFSFDYLYINFDDPSQTNDPDLTFFLKTLRVDSFDRPVFGQ